MNDYKAGELIIYTEGCYSDYVIGNTYRCVKDFTLEEQIVGFPHIAKFHTLWGTHVEVKYDFGKFVDYLVAAGYIEQVAHAEMYLGAYSGYEMLIEDYDKFIKELKK